MGNKFELGIAFIIIGILLTFIHLYYFKPKEVGKGNDTPEKRISTYASFTYGALFIIPGLIFIFIK